MTAATFRMFRVLDKEERKKLVTNGSDKSIGALNTAMKTPQ